MTNDHVSPATEPLPVPATVPAPVTVDTVIVGAGIAGASLAWQLLQSEGGADAAPGPAPRVLLLEREDQPGRHSTGRSAAMFMETYGPPQVRALTRASRSFYEAPPAGFLAEGEALLTPRGALYVAAPGQLDLLEQTEASLAPQSPGLRRLDATAACALVPVLRRDQVLAALHDPAGSDIDVHALHQGYLRGFRRAGGQLWTRAEVAAGSHDGQAWQLTLADGRTVRAAQVVNAAGAWADEVGAALGAAPVGLVPHRRSAFTFEAPAGLALAGWPAVVGIDESWYFKPDAGRLLGSPANADPTVPHDVCPEELDIALGIDRIQTATTLSIRRPASTWAGLRSFVADGELVIGPDGARPGLFWLAAQGGYGIQSAAGAARLATALLRGEPPPEALAREGVEPAALAPGRLRSAAG